MLWTLFVYIAVYFGLFTGIYFIFTFFENLKELRERPIARYPVVGIIVPAYNEEDTITGTLYSLLNLDYPKDKLEIIVINDGSTDDTLKVARKFEKRGVKVYSKENGGKASALNFGLSKFNGELIGCLDADSFVMSYSLKKMIGYFEEKDIMAVTPSIKVWKDKNFLQKIQKVEYLTGVFLRKSFAYLDSIHVTPGPFTIYRKEFFDKYGGYEVGNLTEDIEIALRIQRNGYRIENVMDANVYTIGPSKFGNLLRQRRRWYVGFITNVLRYKDLFGVRQGNLGLLVLPSSFISIGLAIILFGYAVVNFLLNGINNLANYSSVGYDFLPFLELPNVDVFYFNMNPVRILAFISLLIGFSMLLISKKYSRENSMISALYFLYIAVYWVLFAFWWMVAIGYKIFKKRVTW
jgi:cellulose synthase/poly-beta-1,6-N-acetylglucosamine synthase-like glycosyltransferase